MVNKRMILKYMFSMCESVEIEVFGENPTLMHIDKQDGVWCAWVAVNVESYVRRSIKLKVYGTGQAFDRNPLYNHFTTILDDGFVWHVYSNGLR